MRENIDGARGWEHSYPLPRLRLASDRNRNRANRGRRWLAHALSQTRPGAVLVLVAFIPQHIADYAAN
eukprot:2384981-Alexandrium_andersonii.AAC.1